MELSKRIEKLIEYSGLNMLEPLKPLIDSWLVVFAFPIATKLHQKR